MLYSAAPAHRSPRREAADGRPAERPAPAPAATPLVGREREQAALRDALAAALAGRGSLVLIGGEAGIGKTALAEALLAEAAAQGALVLVGRCYDLTETPPYGPWAEALGRAPRAPTTCPAPPDLAGRRRGAPARRRSSPQVRDYLAALAAAPAAGPPAGRPALGRPRLPRPAARPRARPRRPAPPAPRHLPRRRADPPPPALRAPARSWCARPAPRGSTCARSTRPALARAGRGALRPAPTADAARLVAYLRGARGGQRLLHRASCCGRWRRRARCAATADGWALGDLGAVRAAARRCGR